MTSDYGENIPYEVVPESSNKEYKRSIWSAAIGLQAVDGLKPSQYLISLANDNINGKKTYSEISEELNKEYKGSCSRQKEADIVSCRIAQILEQSSFVMSSEFLLSIHDFLFEDVFEPEWVGRYRKVNLTKKEDILYGDTVYYTDFLSIKSQLRFLLEEELSYNYSKPMTLDDIEHLSEFTRNIWQTHPFREGNTRTTAVFIEMYLRSLGYDINNDPFKDNGLYYRNALVRSCYRNDERGVNPTYEYLNIFYKNILNQGHIAMNISDQFIPIHEELTAESNPTDDTDNIDP